LATSIESQVASLLASPLTAPKSSGLPTSTVQSAAVIQTIAANLLIYPRTILYVAHLARQGLLNLANEELAQIQLVLQDAANMANNSVAITDTSSLTDAQTALLQIQDNTKVDVKNNSFTLLDNSIQSFLDEQLAPNVKKPGATSLTVPSTEAGPALAADYASLKTQHSQLLTQLYALGVGVQNFAASPINSLLGTNAAAAVSADIQDIIDSIEADPSGNGSADFTNRLIADRATLSILGTPLDYTSPKIDTVSSMPVGYSLQALSSPANAIAQGTVIGPFSGFGGSGILEIIETIGSGGTSSIIGNESNLLQSLNNPAIYGDPVSFPVTIPAQTHLYLTLTALSTLTGWTQAADGTWQQSLVGGGWQQGVTTGLYTQTFKATLNTGGSPVSLGLSTILFAINTAIGGYGINGDPSTGNPFTAVQFAVAGSEQILIYASATKYQSIGISHSYGAPLTNGGPVAVLTNNATQLLGFSFSDQGTANSVPGQQLVDAMNLLYHSVASASLAPNGSIVLTSNSNSQGTSLAISGAWANVLGLPAETKAESNTLTLQGTVLGIQTNPVNPIGLLDPGDVVILPTGQTTAASISATGITLTDALPTFQLGNVTVNSALYLAWQVLNSDVQAQIQLFLASKFAAGTGPLDNAIAALAGNATAGTINAATAYLNAMSTLVQGLATALADPNSLLPTGSAQTEIANSNGIVQTLTERNYDKALDYYHQCMVAQMLTMDYQTASYAGSFMAAAQAVSQNDINYPNTALDEGTGPSGFQPNRPGTA
jgi:hypothetical protein